MAYTALQISQYIIKHTKGSVSNLKLQKMLFYAQVEYIQKYKESLFEDSIEAWRHGPVIREVYRTFKKYMSSPIPVDAQELSETKIDEFLLDQNAVTIVQDVILKTQEIDPWKLVTKTHNTSAWKDNYVENCNNEISFLDMLQTNNNLSEDH